MNITVTVKSETATTGTLSINGKSYDCAIGRAGVTAPAQKTEGDGKTPLGTYPLRQLLYRADRVAKPVTQLPTDILTPETAWCENPAHADYNKLITTAHPAATDRMTREDHVYDYVVVIGYNDSPVMPGKGSAIFMHLARPDFTPTAGCVGLRAADMLEVLKACTPATSIDIRLI
jgi:L,D-peptidoglycan transpeptidase YkuD (ErfK/YbiS/YcfS/YnhG family)